MQWDMNKHDNTLHYDAPSNKSDLHRQEVQLVSNLNPFRHAAHGEDLSFLTNTDTNFWELSKAQEEEISLSLSLLFCLKISVKRKVDRRREEYMSGWGKVRDESCGLKQNMRRKD